MEDIENALGRSLPLMILRNEAKCALKSSKYFEKTELIISWKSHWLFQKKNGKQGEIL